MFVFEGHEVEWIVDGLVDEPFHWPLLAALDEWRPLLEDNPRIARPTYSWKWEALEQPSLRRRGLYEREASGQRLRSA